ncbi:MAG TPA: ABC transporter permease [Longimicrobium sp.]|nr:ABC transporter permease [Longimicrobium sp.]
MEALLRAVHRALRGLRRAPAFTLTVVATLALGIGATTAMFALVDAVLLRPLPFPAAERVVAVQHTAPGVGVEEGGQSDGTYLHYRGGNRVFEAMGAYVENVVNVTDGADPERLQVAMATPSLFAVLGSHPHRGRLFTEADAALDAPAVVVISHGLWTRRYGSDPAIVGRTIELNRLPREVVGVLPPGFDFPRAETQVWYNMPVEAASSGISDLYLTSVARLKPGVSAADAERDLARLLPGLSDAYADATPDALAKAQLRPRVIPLRELMIRDARPALVLLFCTACFVLLIALANVANLFLVRAEARRREAAVERALGATRGELVRRSVAEALLLSAMGAAVGMGLAAAAVEARFGFGEGQIPRLAEVRITALVVAVAVGITLAAGLLLGAISAARIGRAELSPALKGGGRSTTGRESQNAQRVLVSVQVALALALLIGAAVMVQSFWRLRQVELGFDPRGVLTVELSLPFREYPKYQDAARFHHQLLARLRAVRGVQWAEAASGIPLTQRPATAEARLAVVGRPPAPGQAAPSGTTTLVTPGYFDAMRIPLQRGRRFEKRDVAANAPAVVLSAALARSLFGAEDPVGGRVRLEGKPSYPAYTVVGVAGGVPGAALGDSTARTLYFPVIDDPRPVPESEVPLPSVPREVTVVVRSTLPPAALLAAFRGALRQVDPKLPLGRVRLMDEIVAESTARTRLTMVLLTVAAAVALFLGVIGIYGVISYAVSQKTQELGIRLALGASPAQLRMMLLRQGAALTLAGIAAGVLVALALTRALRALLFQVSPGSPPAFVAMALLVFAVALGATYLPARRAGRIEPVRAMRAE